MDLLVANASEVATLSGPAPRRGEALDDAGIVEDAGVYVVDGEIDRVDRTGALPSTADVVIDADGGTVVPGFVDPHTHVCFAGHRAEELGMKLRGATYREIAERGGGIPSTVEATRGASVEELVAAARPRLDRMVARGTTTVEAKSGYGLTLEAEGRMLDAIAALDDDPIEVVPTFMGAHAVPEGTDADAYVDRVVDEMLPAVADRAAYCDVFVEEGYFTPAQGRRVLEAAADLGLGLRVHADELSDQGAAELAVELGATSADHLLRVSGEGIEALAGSDTVATLLPAVPDAMLDDAYPPARAMIEAGVAVALGTDMNPNCWCESMQLVQWLACVRMGLTPTEALAASTVNAACALDRGDRVGRLEPGMRADLLVLDAPTHAFVAYGFGTDRVRDVVVGGRPV